MRTRYHLVLFDRAPDTILLEKQGTLWLIPSIVANEEDRGAHVIQRCLDDLEMKGRTRWMEFVSYESGRDELQMLAVVDLDGHGSADPFVPVPLSDVDVRHAMLEPQGEVVGMCRTAALADTVDFRSASVWNELDGWITDAVRRCGGRREGRGRQHGAFRGECVMEIPTDVGTMYFKGICGGPFIEADVGQYLSTFWPARIPRTLAYDRERCWWLTRQAAGRQLLDVITLDNAHAVVETLATLQADSCRHQSDLRRIGCPTLDLHALRDFAVALLRGTVAHRAWIIETIVDACAALERLSPPTTWLHTDLAGTNIFIEGSAVTFIDFGSPALGPAPIALYTFLHHLPTYVPRERLVQDGWAATLKERYVRAWSRCGWNVTEQIFRAAKVMTYVMRTERLLRGVSTSRIRCRQRALQEIMRERAAMRLADAIWAMHRSSSVGCGVEIRTPDERSIAASAVPRAGRSD